MGMFTTLILHVLNNLNTYVCVCSTTHLMTKCHKLLFTSRFVAVDFSQFFIDRYLACRINMHEHILINKAPCFHKKYVSWFRLAYPYILSVDRNFPRAVVKTAYRHN